jgi:hypothetical protein
MALVAGATRTIVETLLVYFGTDNQYAIALPDRTFHEFGAACAKSKVGLVENRVNAVLPQALSQRKDPLLMLFAVP